MFEEINKVQLIITEIDDTLFDLKDIYLLTYLARDSKYLVVEGIYGREFAQVFWNKYYGE
jgi:hypothetical protein